MSAASFDPVVSIFPSATDAETVENIPLSTVMARIRSDELASISQRIREAFSASGGGKAGKRATEAMKRSLPGVTLAGAFDRRATLAWRAASALVQFDLDHLDAEALVQARRTLMDSPWVACLWVSPSGSGIKGAVRVAELSQTDPDRYRMAWRAVTRWLESLGMVNDAAAKDAARLAFLAHDPEAWHNPSAVSFDPLLWAEPTPEFPNKYARAREASGSTIECRALAYVRAMPASVQGNNGSAAMVAVVRTLRDGFELSGASLWRVLETWNSEHADPAWRRAELERALESVEREPSTRERGWLLNSKVQRMDGRNRQESLSPSTEWASERLLAERLSKDSLRLSLRFVPEGPATGWHRWDGSTWISAPDPVPTALAAAIHMQAGTLMAAGKLDQKIARALESTASMRAILAQLQSHEPMRFDPATINPPRMIATLGGFFDFDTGEMMPAKPDGPAFLHRTAVAFDPSASHPLWDAVAAHVASMPAGGTVRRFMGASLIGIPPDRKLLILLGDGGDGKGTLLRSCVAAAGGFGAVLPAEALSGDGRGAHGHEILASLSVARLAYASEVPPDLDWPLIKALTGGDLRKTKRLHGRGYEVQPRAWLALATNQAPRPPDQAAADRCVVICWTKPSDPDPDIVALLATPGPERDAYLRACLAWMMEGAGDFLQNGLGVPDFAQPKVEPEGLAGWWSESVQANAIIPGRGWSPLDPLRDHASNWHASRGADVPTDTTLGTFLRTRLASKRTMVDGRKRSMYRASLADGVGRG